VDGVTSQADDRPAAGADDAVHGDSRALVRHRYGRWLSKADAGRQLLAAGYRADEMIEQSMAARAAGPCPQAGKHGLSKKAYWRSS
jgi:hypothetical protein